MTLVMTEEQYRRFSWNIPKEICEQLIKKKEIAVQESVEKWK